ncbi:NADPH-dependent FMN reductase [Actibacterium sp. D379-3]
MSQYDVALLVGSFRTGSLNQRLADALVRLAPETLRFQQVPMADLPFYNGDLEPGRTDAITRFTSAIAAADAVLIVTPEYNRSIPAVLKNAIDWASKPMEANVWRDMPVTSTGTSPGAIGTAVGQQHLRQVLAVLGAHVMPGESYISFKSPDLISEDGDIGDDSTKAFLKAYIDRFAGYVARLQG